MGLASKLAAAQGAAPQAFGGAPSGVGAPPGTGAPPPGAPAYAPQPQQGQQWPPQQGYPPQQGFPPKQAAAGYPPQQPQQGYPPQGLAPGQQQGWPPAAAPQQQGWPPVAAPQQQGWPPALAPPGAYPGGGAPMQGEPPSAPPAPGGAYPGAYPGAPPQHQHQQPGYGPPPGGAGVSAAAVLPRLEKLVQANGLQRFYPPQQLHAVAARVAAVDFQALATKWRMPVELALDFAGLALYDIILYCDDSGSMAFEDGGERIEDLRLILGRAAEVATLFDDDGILVRFMNSPAQGNGLRTAADAAALLGQVNFGGTTPLAASMRSRVLEPVVFAAAARGALAKPVLVITITDGEPTDTPKDAILQVIRDARGRLAPAYGPKAVAFQFAQVGRDARAQAFLGRLDKDPSVGDVIDCTSYFEQEAEEYARKGVSLSVEAWLLKLMVGAIDPSYDAEDE